jgi:hypothetical protein
VCSEAGVKVCFFHDFNSWHDYIEGKIDEVEFYDRAKVEIDKMSKKVDD